MDFEQGWMKYRDNWDWFSLSLSLTFFVFDSPLSQQMAGDRWSQAPFFYIKIYRCTQCALIVFESGIEIGHKIEHSGDIQILNQTLSRAVLCCVCEIPFIYLFFNNG